MVNITVQYRDGGEDKFYNIAASSIQDRVFIIEESNHSKVFVNLNAITFAREEEVESGKKKDNG